MAERPMTDSHLQRTNMVESQIRPSDVTDRRILRAMQIVPRERFVPDDLKALAYMDDALPLATPAGVGARRHLSPRTLAKLLQAARIEPGDTVLVLGAGRGYGAAIAAHMAHAVVAHESDMSLADAARTALADLANVTVSCGPLTEPPGNHAPYDVIVLEGSVPEAPAVALDLLAPGGRMVGLLEDKAIARAVLWQTGGTAQRPAADTAPGGAKSLKHGFVGCKILFEASGSPLPGFARAAPFVL